MSPYFSRPTSMRPWAVIRRGGFTLIELMIAVCIIGVLASVAMPTYQRFVQESKGAEGITIVSQLYKGAVAYWERPFGTQGMTASAAGHCFVDTRTDTADGAEAVAGMPPLPPVPHKRTANYASNAVYSALSFNRADPGYFTPLPISENSRGFCNPGDGMAYHFLAIADVDGDGLWGGYYLPVVLRNGELSRSPGYKDLKNFMNEAMGAECPFCASGMD